MKNKYRNSFLIARIRNKYTFLEIRPASATFTEKYRIPFMKLRFIITAATAFIAFAASAQPGREPVVDDSPEAIGYYLPAANASFDQDILTPQAFLGFDLGERMADWGDITRYAEYLASKSPRVSLEWFGYTVDRRRYFQMRITSPQNQARLEDIRLAHLKVLDAGQSADPQSLPLIVDLRGSIHGNEISGAQGLLPVMYYYAAARDVEGLLDNTVILIVPAQNPDGISRFATWVNTTSSRNHFVDSQSREYHETWPASRFNHYWMDINRDWLTAQYPEGQNLVRMYLRWMPHVLLDLHEMGGGGKNGLYYFSPGDATRTYKYIPEENQTLTRAIGRTTGKYLDATGTPWYSEKGYDDFFIGKGACYGDIQGSICILHERSSTRGHLHMSKHRGLATFAQTVRTQSYGAIAVVDGATANSAAIKAYQRKFFEDARKACLSDAYKGYTFNARGNRGIAFNFIENLLLHGIEVRPVKGSEGEYFVPFAQMHYYKIKGIFEDITEYNSGKFYDVSTWSPARGWNIDYKTVRKEPATEPALTAAPFPKGSVPASPDASGYAFRPDEFYTPHMISALQRKGIKVKVDTRQNPGLLVIPAEDQPFAGNALLDLIREQAELCSVDVLPLSGRNKGIDPAKMALSDVRMPRTAIITDNGGAMLAGSIWHMLDHHFAMNHSLVKFSTFTSKDFDPGRYDAMIFSGNVNTQGARKAFERLDEWVRKGGTLLLIGPAHKIAKYTGGDNVKTETGKGVKGLVLNAGMDLGSPLFWGYGQKTIDVFKGTATVWTVDGADVLMSYTSDPYRSGYVKQENLDKFCGAPIVATRSEGEGRIIYIQESFAYRGYWNGTNHILTNALLFGNLM